MVFTSLGGDAHIFDVPESEETEFCNSEEDITLEEVEVIDEETEMVELSDETSSVLK